jgi:hypothetical protein
MPQKPVMFLDVEYKSQSEFKKYVDKFINDEIGICYDIKNKYPNQYRILIELLKRHPDWNSKSENMCNIKIVNNKYKTGLEVIIIKNDGEIDISWKSTINGKSKSQEEKLKDAMRSCLDEQLSNFRNLKKNCRLYYCEKCYINQKLQVDHNDEKNSEFGKLASDFLKNFKQKNTNLTIPNDFGDLNDGTHRKCFLEKDSVFKNEWLEYHYQHAILRILCHNCNNSRPKTQIKLLL